MEPIRHVGKRSLYYTYSDVRLEWKGFASLFTFTVTDFPHRALLIHRRNAVVVLPANFETRELYMIEEPRHVTAFAGTPEGAAAIADAKSGGTSENRFTLRADDVRLLEMPAGVIDGDETPEQTAVRELREETGLVVTIDKLIRVASYYPSIGACTERLTAFIARLDEPVTQVHTDGDGSEQITVWKMSWDEAFTQLANGRVQTASANLLLRELRIRDLTARR